MADIPVPRSYEQIRGDIIDSFIARTGISSLKVGSPILAIIEAVAQSQFRNTKDVFGLLEASSLDYATGDALTQLAADEGIARKSAVSAFGYVTFIDNSFSKVSTQLTTSANRGQSEIEVVSVSGFSAGDSISVDGESATIVSIDGTKITLDHTLAGIYSVGAEVLLTTSDVRTIPSGTIVSTGNVNFSTTNTYSIASGQTAVTGVPVVCNITGTGGNIPAKSISKILSASPFEGATVTNYLAFVNGQDQETDAALRDRVRAARRNKQRGTAASIVNAVTGAVAYDESKRVVSANLVDTASGKATLYIDDGSGYEGVTTPVGIEVLTASAVGGEVYFELQGGRPVAQCFVECSGTFPRDLSDGCSITVLTPSGSSSILLNAEDASEVFSNPKAATSYEFVSWINSDIGLKFYASTRNGHTKVVLIPKGENDNKIKVTLQANLDFSTEFIQTLYLFKNGLILLDGTDYKLNRNKGQIFLEEQLVQGDSLTVGSVDIRVGIVTNLLNSTGADLSDQYFWLVADDEVTSKASLSAGDSVTVTYNDTDKTVTLTGPTDCFDQVSGSDWLVIWDSSFSRPWTKRVKESTSSSVTVDSMENISGTYSILEDGGLRVFRTNSIPQMVTGANYLSLSQMAQGVESQLVGIHVVVLGNRLGFYTNSYASDGAISFLTATSYANSILGLSTTTKENPAFYQTSIKSAADVLFPDTYAANAAQTNLLPLLGGVFRFATGQQAGLVTTKEESNTYRKTLNNEVINSETVYFSQGYHLSDSDTIVFGKSVIDTYSVPFYLDGKINSTAVTTLAGDTLPFLSDYSLNDWAVWSLSNQKASPETGGDAVEWTSKKYGPSNLVSKIEYAYPTSANQDFSYTLLGHKMSVLLKSGAAITPSILSTQKLWVSNYDNGAKTTEIGCVFAGVIEDDGGGTYYIQVPDATEYYDKGLVGTDCYVFVHATSGSAELNRNFKVSTVNIGIDDRMAIGVEQNIAMGAFDGQTALFSVSKDASASELANFSAITEQSLTCWTTTNITFRTLPAGATFDPIKIRYSEIANLPLIWEGSELTFFERDTTTPMSFENDYFFTDNTSVIVSESTYDLFDFNSSDAALDGLVDGYGESLDYVKDTSSFAAKGGTTYSDCEVRFIPVTSSNVADWFNYQMSFVNIVSAQNSQSCVEVVNSEGGADSTVEVTQGTGNSFSTSDVTSLEAGSLKIPASYVGVLVIGHKVQIGFGSTTANVTVTDIEYATQDKVKVLFTPTITPTSFPTPTLTALNKLGFPVNEPATNSDGYKYYAGLIGEANRIVYGDPADPVNYSGFASANANIEVTGPQVKQVKMTIFVKMSGGFTMTDAKASVRNAAASAVNSTPVGQSVAYSDIVAAVNAVFGVFSVAIANFTENNPVIPVLAYEKPLVIDLEKDIEVNIVGI